jgi:hydrogenase/urease accessory protein HupE
VGALPSAGRQARGRWKTIWRPPWSSPRLAVWRRFASTAALQGWSGRSRFPGSRGRRRTSGWRALQPVVVDYTELGIEHILTGFDHLLFVVALVFLVRGRGQLLATITAFTVAHSLSLAATVLGLVHVPSPPVEASIALSIVLVCAECLRGDHLEHASLTRRAPWAVAFAFGLLHGLGFASALLELGVPEQHLPAALFCFNVGVELGQLAVVAVVIGLRRLATRLRINRDWMRSVLVYAMGSLAAYWSIDRIGAVFSAGLGAGLGR